MRSDRLTFVSGSRGKRPVEQYASHDGGFRVEHLVKPVRAAIAGCLPLILITLLTGCSNAQVRRTPVTDLGEAWFCEMNETRDDWDCVQDDALAKNPQPTRLPSDPVEPDPFEEDVPALPEVAADSEALANPSAAINFDAIAAAATTRPDSIAALMERSPEHFAVQLTATETRALADGFIANHDLDDFDELITLELAQEEDFYYVILLGIYSTLAEAQAAVDSLPDSISEIQPWIRPLASIQSGIEDAEALHMGLSN